MELAGADGLLLGGGLALGAAFGALAQRSRFCLVAAVANWRLMRDPRQLAAWLAALATAIALTQALELSGVVAVGESSYRGARLDWLGAAAGGLLFGVGAMLAGGCAGRTVVNAAEGSGGSLLALVVFALAAALTQYGPLDAPRLAVVNATAVQLGASDAGIAAVTGLPACAVAIALAVAAAATAVAFARRSDWSMTAVGVAAGVLVAAGWWVTGSLGRDEFAAARPDSLSYSGPLARAGWLALGGSISAGLFGLAVLGGTLAGAAGSAIVAGRWRFVPPPRGRRVSLVAGGILMGIGAVLAGGCNIGHGLTGLAALSVKSLIVVAAIVAGLLAGLAWLERHDSTSAETA